MKKYVYHLLILIVVLITTNCKKSDYNFTIDGKLKLPAGSEVFLGNLGIDKVEIVDSVKVREDGTFHLKGYCMETSLYVMNIFDESIYLIIKPGDELKIDIDNTLEILSYYVNGSSDSRLVRELIFKQQKVLDEITQISIAYEKSKENPDDFLQKKQYYDSLYDNLLMQHKKYTIRLIEENPNSLATIFALYQNFGKTNQPLFDKFDDFSIFNFVDSNLSQNYPNTPAVIALNKDVTEIKEQLDFKRYSESLIQPGRSMPVFEVTSIDNQKLNLSKDLSGHPVILFFFAVWNNPSTRQAKELSEISQKYRYRGLRVIGFSFDTSQDRLKSFINDNNIVFPVICDYKYWDSKYVKQFGIRSVPDIILLNKDHIIKNRSLEIPELKIILEEWRKNDLF